jgi:hypothetical protein
LRRRFSNPLVQELLSSSPNPEFLYREPLG